MNLELQQHKEGHGNHKKIQSEMKDKPTEMKNQQ